MLAWLRKSVELLRCDGTERQACVSFVVSTGFHLAVLVGLGLLWTFSSARNEKAPPEWVTLLDAPAEQPRETPLIESFETPQTSQDGGSENEALFAVSTTTMSAPKPPPSNSARYFESRLPAENLLETVVDASTAQSGEGAGRGSGAGSGEGKGFFGLTADGQSFVFVVDRSRSMYHPHPGPAKTRFKRLKIEILRAVREMDDNQEFFIVFFNDEALPMPARTLQPATAAAKKRFLYWVSEVDANGMTDPEQALTMALRLQPDVIYFLTDGAFPKKVQRRLLTLKQDRTKIHTFVFGDNTAEVLMETIAAQNGGEYKFIP